jgi:hypothetical protein
MENSQVFAIEDGTRGLLEMIEILGRTVQKSDHDLIVTNLLIQLFQASNEMMIL